MTLPTWPQKQCEHYHPEKNDSGNENTFTISSFKFIYPGPADFYLKSFLRFDGKIGDE